MNLSQALRLPHSSRLALVGSGGKTTALFQLAYQLAPPVLVTATTHLAVEQLRLANRHIIVQSPAAVTALSGELSPGVILLTGPPAGDERISGLDPASLEQLLVLADAHRLPVLVEADGSRRRPLKAPAAHEPALPEWADTVVVTVGLAGLGQPLGPEWVHRPERFGEISGLADGEPVTVAALAKVLTSRQGGLKNIPAGARRVALLNQADSPERQAQAYRLAQALLPQFHSVIVAALGPAAQENSGAAGPMAGQPKNGTIFAVHEPVAGIILAAGGAQRLGQPKQLLEWRGEPFVRRVARTALAAGLAPVLVVTGAYAEEVWPALEGLAVHVVHNPDWESGQGVSVSAGVQALPPETGAVIFLLADQPQVPATLLRSLVETHARDLPPLVAPQAGGRRANPVLFDRQTFPDLRALSGETGGRVLFSRYPVAWLEWHDPSLLLDVDTIDDYQRLLELDL